MATTFFPRTISPVTDPSLPAAWSGAIERALSLTRGGSAASEADSTVASLGTSSASAGVVLGSVAPANGNWVDGLTFVTEPLNAVTVSGTVTVNIRGAESNAMANYGAAVQLYLFDGATMDLFGNGEHVTEFGTSEAARNFTITPGSRTLSGGERIAVVLGFVSVGGTSASGFTATQWFDGPTGAASGDAFVTFTETITEQAAVAANPPYRNQMPQLLAH